LPAVLTLLVCQLALSQVPDASAPPLVPIEEAADPELLPPSQPPPPATLEEPEEEESTTPRPKRVAGTLLGALLGDAVTAGVWLLTGAVLLGACGADTTCSNAMLISTGLTTGLTLGPLGPLAGNRVAGGRAPYWKVLCGTVAGLALSAVVLGLFSATNNFGSTSSGIAAIGVSVLPLVAAQTLSSEL
jgi:hypothetical protein